MAILKIKDETGKFVDIPAIQGPPGKDGAIQYEAGEGIKIEDNVISVDGEMIKKLISENITETLEGEY